MQGGAPQQRTSYEPQSCPTWFCPLSTAGMAAVGPVRRVANCIRCRHTQECIPFRPAKSCPQGASQYSNYCKYNKFALLLSPTEIRFLNDNFIPPHPTPQGIPEKRHACLGLSSCPTN